MAKLQGTILASKIVPTDSLDTYATHDDKYGRGGHRSVDTIVERDEISPERRKEGMTVYVKSTKVKYVLEGGLTNEFWLPEASGGSIDLSNYYKKLETYSKVEVDTKIADIPPTDLSEYYKKTEVDAIALDKVDKVAGKQLSTEDYTTAEKTKLTGLSNYVKPVSEPISYIDGLQSALGDKVDKVSKQALDSNNALRVTGTIVSLYKGDGTFDSITTQDTIYTHPNSVVTAGTYSKVTVNAQGHITAGASLSASDIPSLDASKITSGTIDSARLPSFVDDVLEFVNLAGFPTTGETGKIYIALDTNKTYRWSGSTYVFITSGAVDSVAGKTGVVTLIKGDVGLNNVDNTSDLNKPISTATQTALDTKQEILVSGTSVKTINGQSVLGGGNIEITDGGSVQLTGNQTVDGVKTFSSNVVGNITGNSATTTKLKTPVKINGIDFDGSVDITIEAGGSGSSTFTGTAAIDIGGVKVGDSWNNAPISDVVNAIINPELFPTFVNPTFSFTSTVNGFREVGSVTDITFNVNFSRGSITPQYSAENNYRSGLPTTYNYNGPVGSEAKANNTLTDTKTITGYSIAIGSNTFSCSVDYSIGTQPKSSKGNDYNTPLPAGTLAAKSVTITGVYPVYNGIGTLSKIPLQAHGTAIVVDAPADMVVGGNRFTIQYPNIWSGKTPVVQQENELSKAWDNQSMSDYEITDIVKSSIAYKQVKYIGSGIGARKLRLVF